MKSRNLASTIITPKIRVSSGVIDYDAAPVPYTQYETFIFSNDPSQRTRQIIHGTDFQESKFQCERAVKIHGQIVRNLQEIYHSPEIARS